MRISQVFLTSTLFILFSSCASIQADWVNSNCNVEASYATGMNDGRSAKNMNNELYSHYCSPESRDAIMSAYRKGYESGVASTKEPVSDSERGNHGTIINVGIGNGVRLGTGRGSMTRSNPKAWFCEIKIFGQTYSAFGSTQLEAKQAAKLKCSTETNEMHCEDISCEKNQ